MLPNRFPDKRIEVIDGFCHYLNMILVQSVTCDIILSKGPDKGSFEVNK